MVRAYCYLVTILLFFIRQLLLLLLLLLFENNFFHFIYLLFILIFVDNISIIASNFQTDTFVSFFVIQ